MQTSINDHVFQHIFKLPFQYSTAPHDIPKQCFGVFVTIRRAHELSAWPTDIHGCIGHWESYTKSMSAGVLLQNALRVGYDAMFTDSRVAMFPPIVTDPRSEIETSFMMLPVQEIDPRTGQLEGKPFSNKTHGVIVEGAGGSRATYLPDVFPGDTAWSAIRDSVTRKAGASRAHRFLAYRTVQRRSRLIDLVYSNVVSYYSKLAFCRFVKRAYPQLHDIAYARNADGTLVADASQTVRNVSTITSAMAYNDATVKDASLQRVLATNLSMYESRRLSPQALSFALPAKRSGKSDTCKTLRGRVPSADREFETGEIIQAVGKYCPAEFRRGLESSLTGPIRSIFQWNWDSQALVALGATSLQQKYIRWLLRYKPTSDETNVVAVTFEGASAHIKSGATLPDAFLVIAFSCFLTLMERHVDGLYAFLDGSARLDIATHFINGLL